MSILEREGLLAELQAQWRAACAGGGRLLFVEGEAGIGKTTLLRTFAQSLRGEAVLWWGSCEALLTPRPLAVLDDIALRPRGDVAALQGSSGQRHRLFVAFVDLLAERPSLAVLEDLHWADEATLDLLRYAGRRIARTRSLLVASFRNDELVPAHPLRVVLGDLATTGAVRLAPPPLSPEAVRVLCGARGVDAAEVHRKTGGNPFFVTEVLAAGGHGVPATVQDAVLARAARLSPSARAVLDAAAVAGPRVEAWLLQELTAAESAAIDECLATGVLQAREATFSFRHELARQAVLLALTPTRAMTLHRLVLQSLQSRGAPGSADAARLALHADGAGDAEAARRWAAEAACDAAAQGAHRQAADHWALALKHTPAGADRAHALDAYATECRVCGRLADALAAQHDAALLWGQLRDTAHEAIALSRRGLWLAAAARQDEAQAAIRAALALVSSPDADPVATITVRRHAAAMHMMDHDTEAAIALARAVLHAAERIGDAASVVQAHLVVGSALLSTDRSDDGVEHLQLALGQAEARHDDTSIASALLNLGSGCAENFRLDEAERWLLRGIRFCVERDIDMSRLYQLSWLAVVRLHQGRWNEASDAAHEVLTDRRAAAVARITALIALGRLRARRGDPGVWDLLDEARTLAAGTGSLQRLAPMHAARAEAAWIEGRAADAAREAAAGLPLASAKRVPTFTAELLLWCRRGGADSVAVPAYCAAHPFALEAAGDWRQAAAAWTLRHCRYEAACSLAGGGDEAAQRQALATFEALGSRPLAERVRHLLRRAGVRGLPRGPRRSTQQQPARLTDKEVAVLKLLASGLRNKEIAERLSRSSRTVDHHLESIFAKLGVATRAEAVGAAYRLGIGSDVGAEESGRRRQ